MTIRPLVEADLTRVVQIERAAFTDPWSRRAFEELMAQPQLRAVALDAPDGRLAGYALYSLVAGEGEILNLAVDPAARRRGYGRLLLETVLEALRAAGASAVYLEVRQSNAAAIQLYTGAGFRRLSLRKKYYSNPVEHAVTMALQLAPVTAEKG